MGKQIMVGSNYTAVKWDTYLILSKMASSTYRSNEKS